MYCVDYETVVLDEIRDLANAEDKDLEVSLDERRNKVTLHTSQDRKLKARIVQANHCAAAPVAYGTLR